MYWLMASVWRYTGRSYGIQRRPGGNAPPRAGARAKRVAKTSRSCALMLSREQLLHARNFSILELHHHVLFADGVIAAEIAGDIVINVVPAVRVKRIFDHGRAHHEAHLRLGHTGLQLLDHGWLEEITLLDIRAIDTGTQCQCRQDNR